MPKAAVIYKPGSPEAQDLARELAAWLTGRGAACKLYEAAGPTAGREPGPVPDFDPDTGLAVVLGGDGTMLSAVRALTVSGLTAVPILGVNLGGLGFLTAVAKSELMPAMEKVLAGDYQAPPRMMLKATVRRGEKALAEFTALNEVVINKAALAGIVELAVSVDQKPLTTFRADGLVFSTPTGSTAYNLSAGGPICYPALDCIIITPLASFALSNRPLLVGAQMTLDLALDGRASQTSLTCDGQVGIDLKPHDRVTISRSERAVRLILSPFNDYFEILRTKLRWG